MPCGQDDIRRQVLLLAIDNDPLDGLVPNHKIGDARIKMHFATVSFYGVADGLDYLRQLVRANMGMCIHQNVCVRTMLDQEFQHFAYVSSFLCGSIEFAARVGAGPTLAETVIRIWIDSTELLNRPQVRAALLHVFAAVENHRLNAVLQQLQPRKISRWPCTHDDDLVVGPSVQ